VTKCGNFSKNTENGVKYICPDTGSEEKDKKLSSKILQIQKL
jgi:hypothetical protein